MRETVRFPPCHDPTERKKKKYCITPRWYANYINSDRVCVTALGSLAYDKTDKTHLRRRSRGARNDTKRRCLALGNRRREVRVPSVEKFFILVRRLLH